MDFLPSATIKAVIAELEAGGTVAELKRRLIRLSDEGKRAELPAEGSDGHRARGRGYYDRLIEDMLSYVRAAGTREGLVRLVMDRLGAANSDRAADGYLLLEGRISREGTLGSVSIANFSGLQPDRIANFRTRAGKRLAHSPLIEELLVANRSVDFLATELTRPYVYAGEFDELIDRKRGAWIAAVPLPGLDERHPNRALVGLFRVAGAGGQTLLPRGATQEWRCFEFLRAGYELLNHQLASVAEQARAQRRDLMADLAPGIVNHEVNQQVRILADTTDLMNLALRRLPALPPCDPALATLVDALVRQYRVLERLARISSAFTNFYRRTPGGEVRLPALLTEIETLLHYRLANLGVALEVLPYDSGVTLRTDAALLEHILLNILMNALDAFAETERSFGTRRITVSISTLSEERLTILIANNGPPIPETIRERIFDRGVSSKPHGVGHGLGLYICRLAARFLGGDIDLERPELLSAGYAVGFRVDLPRVVVDRGSLADESRADEPPHVPLSRSVRS